MAISAWPHTCIAYLSITTCKFPFVRVLREKRKLNVYVLKSHAVRIQRFGWSVALRPATETVGLLGTGAQDVHVDFHTAPDLWYNAIKLLTNLTRLLFITTVQDSIIYTVENCPKSASRREGLLDIRGPTVKHTQMFLHIFQPSI